MRHKPGQNISNWYLYIVSSEIIIKYAVNSKECLSFLEICDDMTYDMLKKIIP